MAPFSEPFTCIMCLWQLGSPLDGFCASNQCSIIAQLISPASVHLMEFASILPPFAVGFLLLKYIGEVLLCASYIKQV